MYLGLTFRARDVLKEGEAEGCECKEERQSWSLEGSEEQPDVSRLG